MRQSSRVTSRAPQGASGDGKEIGAIGEDKATVCSMVLAGAAVGARRLEMYSIAVDMVVGRMWFLCWLSGLVRLGGGSNHELLGDDKVIRAQRGSLSTTTLTLISILLGET
jgi:hypothetical protein